MARILSPTLPLSNSERLCAQYVSLLNNRSVATQLGVLPFRPYLLFLPNRLGRNRALDDAVSCVCSATNAYLRTGETNPNEAMVWYHRALRAIQEALLQPRLARASELLAAIMVLQWFEARFRLDGGRNWVQHAQGAERLIEWRGAKDFTGDLDGAILKTQLSSMMFSTIADRRPSFMAYGAWAEILREFEKANGALLTPAGQELFSLASDMQHLTKDYTHWQWRHYPTQNARPGFPLPSQRIDRSLFAEQLDLPTRASRVRSRMRTWLEMHATGKGNSPFKPDADPLDTVSSSLPLAASYSQPSQSSQSFDVAFETSCATTILVTSFMLMELRNNRSADLLIAHDETPSANMDVLPPAQELIRDSIMAVEVVKKSSASLSTIHSSGAGLLSGAMSALWQKVVQNPADGSKIVNDITVIVGDLYRV